MVTMAKIFTQTMDKKNNESMTYEANQQWWEILQNHLHQST